MNNILTQNDGNNQLGIGSTKINLQGISGNIFDITQNATSFMSISKSSGAEKISVKKPTTLNNLLTIKNTAKIENASTNSLFYIGDNNELKTLGIGTTTEYLRMGYNRPAWGPKIFVESNVSGIGNIGYLEELKIDDNKLISGIGSIGVTDTTTSNIIKYDTNNHNSLIMSNGVGIGILTIKTKYDINFFDIKLNKTDADFSSNSVSKLLEIVDNKTYKYTINDLGNNSIHYYKLSINDINSFTTSTKKFHHITLRRDSNGPTLLINDSTPANDATNISYNDVVILKFSENVVAGTGNITFKTKIDRLSQGHHIINIDITDTNKVSFNNDTITLSNFGNFNQLGRIYQCTFFEGVILDNANNSTELHNIDTYNFTIKDTVTPPIPNISLDTTGILNGSHNSITYINTLQPTISVSWTADNADVVLDGTNIQIFQSTNNSTFTEISNFTVDTNSGSSSTPIHKCNFNSNLTAGTRYYYKIRLDAENTNDNNSYRYSNYSSIIDFICDITFNSSFTLVAPSNTTDAEIDTEIILEFANEVKINTVSGKNLTLSGSNSATMAATNATIINNNRLKISGPSSWGLSTYSPGSTTLTIPSEALIDVAGNKNSSSIQTTFTVLTPIAVSSRSPPSNANHVNGLLQEIKITFDNSITRGSSGNITIKDGSSSFLQNSSGTEISGGIIPYNDSNVVFSGSILTIRLNGNDDSGSASNYYFKPYTGSTSNGKSITVTISSGVINEYSTEISYSFNVANYINTFMRLCNINDKNIKIGCHANNTYVGQDTWFGSSGKTLGTQTDDTFMWWQMNWYDDHHNYFVQNYSFSNDEGVNLSYEDSGTWKKHVYKTVSSSAADQNNNKWAFKNQQYTTYYAFALATHDGDFNANKWVKLVDLSSETPTSEDISIMGKIIEADSSSSFNPVLAVTKSGSTYSSGPDSMKTCTYIVCQVELQEASSFEGTAGDNGSYAIAWWYRNGYSNSYSYWSLGGSGQGDDTGAPHGWDGYPTMNPCETHDPGGTTVPTGGFNSTRGPYAQKTDDSAGNEGKRCASRKIIFMINSHFTKSQKKAFIDSSSS